MERTIEGTNVVIGGCYKLCDKVYEVCECSHSGWLGTYCNIYDLKGNFIVWKWSEIQNFTPDKRVVRKGFRE